ncbi:MAG: energy-coupling factor transporter transmembrane component T family protein [Promethearchaeota archaeon]
MAGRTSRRSNNYTRIRISYREGDSFLHKLHPFTKFLFAIILSITIVLIRSLILLSAILIILFIIVKSARLSIIEAMKLFKWLVLLVISLISLDVVMGFISPRESEILFFIFKPYMPIYRITIYYTARCISWIISFSLSNSIVLMTTSPKDFITGLTEARFPYKFSFSLMLAFRYLPVIQDEFQAVSIAQRLRGSASSRGNRLKRFYNVLKTRISTFLIVIFRRAFHTAVAIEKKAFGVHKKRTTINTIGFKTRDGIAIAIMFFTFSFILLYNFGILPLPQIPSVYSIYSLLFNT